MNLIPIQSIRFEGINRLIKTIRPHSVYQIISACTETMNFRAISINSLIISMGPIEITDSKIRFVKNIHDFAKFE